MEAHRKTDPDHQENQVDPQENEIDGNVFKKPFNAVFGSSEADEENKDTDVQDRAEQAVSGRKHTHDHGHKETTEGEEEDQP